MPVASLSLQWMSTGLSVGLGLLGILGAWALYRNGFYYQENDNPLYQLVLNKFYVDEFFILVLVQPVLWIGRTASRFIERDALDVVTREVATAFTRPSEFLLPL